MDRARAALADLTALDRTALESLILAQQSELSAQQEKLLSRDSEIEHLKLVIAKLRRSCNCDNAIVPEVYRPA